MHTETRSPLEVFLYQHKITYVEIAEEADISRQTLFHAFRGSYTAETRKKVTTALRRLCERRGLKFIDPFAGQETSADGDA